MTAQNTKWIVFVGDERILVDGENHREATNAAIQLTGGGFDLMRQATEKEIAQLSGTQS